MEADRQSFEFQRNGTLYQVRTIVGNGMTHVEVREKDEREMDLEPEEQEA